MKKKPFFYFLLAIALLTPMLLFQVTLAQETEPDPLVVITHLDGSVYIAESADQPIRLQTSWVANTRGQIVVFLNHSYITYSMTGPQGLFLELPEEETEQSWGPIIQVPSDIFGHDCIKSEWWATQSIYNLDPLPPGEYTLIWNEVFTNPVNDGFHTCTSPEGVPYPAPQLYKNIYAATTTIIVPEPGAP